MMEVAASRIISDLEGGIKANNLIVLSRLVDLVLTLRGENPRASFEDVQVSLKLWKALEPKLGNLYQRACDILQQWRCQIKSGDLVDVYSEVDKKWFPSRIEQISEDKQKLLVHYQGWPSKWDNWIDVADSMKGLSPKESKCKHTQITIPHENWIPDSMKEQIEEEERRAREIENKAEAKRLIEEAAKLEEKERRKEMKAVKQEYDEDGNPIKKRKVEKVKEKERAEDDEGDDDNDWICSECGMLEHPTGNAMLLCDGACMRSFHLPCLGMNQPPSGDWFCPDCLERRHECFICKKKGADYSEVAKCRDAKCGKYYHRACLEDGQNGFYPVEVRNCVDLVPRSGPVRAPETPNGNSSGSSSSSSSRNDSGVSRNEDLVKVQSFRFRCPQHYCIVCDRFFNKTKMDKNKGKNTELFECIECPKAYHINCIPPGARFNSCCLLCDGHPERILPSREPITRAYRGAAGLLEQMGIPEETPDSSDPMDHHFRLPLQLREEVSQEAEPAPFQMVKTLCYESLPGGADAAPSHWPDGMCTCVGYCGEDCWNRLLKIECYGKPEHIKEGRKEGARLRTNCPIGPGCGNRLFSTRTYAKMERFREHAMGMGMRAKEDIKEGTLVCEYVGEVINEAEMCRRMEYQAKYTPNDHEFYIMELDNGIYVDGKHKGSESRHINHSCDPNLELERWVVNGKMKIGIFAIRDIPEGVPLNYDYQFDTRESASFKCFCGAETCRGTMAPKSKDEAKPLSARERRSFIRQGQLRERGGENRLARIEAEWARSHTSKWLPGDKTNEIRQGPHKATYAVAGLAKLFLPKNVIRANSLGWGVRLAHLKHKAEVEEESWGILRGNLEDHYRKLPKALKVTKW